jgi:hypothetical protein
MPGASRKNGHFDPVGARPSQQILGLRHTEAEKRRPGERPAVKQSGLGVGTETVSRAQRGAAVGSSSIAWIMASWPGVEVKRSSIMPWREGMPVNSRT